MNSTASKAKFLQHLTSPPTTPDLTPLGLEDTAQHPPPAASPVFVRRPRARRPSQIAAPPSPPTRTAPLPPPLVSVPKLGTALDPKLSQASQDVFEWDAPGPILGRARTEPLPKPLVPPAKLPAVAPLRLTSAADRLLARALLREPVCHDPSQLLLEDMLGATIFGVSVVGADPLVKDVSAVSHRPLNDFKAFAQGLRGWCDRAPAHLRAFYRVGAMRMGMAKMRFDRTLTLSCLGLADLPSELGRLTQLQSLDVRYNQLSAMPVNCRELRALREADLRHNLFKGIPDVILHLNLETLRIDTFDSATPMRADGRF